MPGQLGWVIFTRSAAGQLQPTRVGATRTNELSQPQCEMQAVEALVDDLLAMRAQGKRGCETCGSPPLMVIAVDADSVRFCISKGYSRDAQFRDVLRRLLGVRIWCTRIAGIHNVADRPSREPPGSVGCSEEAGRKGLDPVFLEQVHGYP